MTPLPVLRIGLFAIALVAEVSVLAAVAFR